METIEDIVREMREQANTWLDKKVPSFCELHDHWMITADRIEAAVHDITVELDFTKAFYAVAVKERDAERIAVNKLLAEIARLRAALKPVLDVEFEFYQGSCCSGMVAKQSCDCAVREAQRIYNKGVKDEDR